MFRLCSVCPPSSRPSRSSWRWAKSRQPRRACSTLGLSSGKSESSLSRSVSVFFNSFAIGINPVNLVEEIGAKSPIGPPTVTSETIATICYTSVRSLIDVRKPRLQIGMFQGTTGNPKGAVLTQGALAAATYSNTCGLDVTPFVTPVLLSFLPLAHIYGVRLLSIHSPSPPNRPVTANDGAVRHCRWWKDRLLYRLPVTNPRGHAGPQTKLLPRSTEASE